MNFTIIDTNCFLAYLTIGDFMFYKNDGITMYYEIHGNKKGEKVLILPGWGDTRITFYNLIEKMKRQFQIYIVDYPGFGNSPFPKKDLTIYDYAMLIKNFMFDNNIENPVIIAHSFGGRISIILSGLYKVRINKMVLIDIAGIRRKSIKRFLKQKLYKFRKRLTFFLPKNKRIKYLTSLKKKYSSVDYISLDKSMYNTFKNIINEDLRKYVKYISCNVLLLWGLNDIDTPINDGYFFNKRIKNSHLMIFPKGSHFVYLEYKEIIGEVVISFIEKQSF